MNILNAALEAHRSNPDLNGFLQACDRRLDGHDLLVEVFEEDDRHPQDRYLIRWREGVFVLAARDAPPGPVAWRVSMQTLDDLVDHARLYVDDPLRLDLNWLRRCLREATYGSQDVEVTARNGHSPAMSATPAEESTMAEPADANPHKSS